MGALELFATVIEASLLMLLGAVLGALLFIWFVFAVSWLFNGDR
jgi:hypothetical protein